MRLARLDLVRYGKFTDHRLDFGPRPADRPDLHIVYGPNEAGKSTAFSAYLDLLFGIRALKEPNYAFLHPYPTMRIGARLDLAGGTHDLVRIRRQTATLLDGEDRPLDEGFMAGDLGGIGRDEYRSMFSLDDTSLEQGGDEILASRGDLGRILFSGSAGAAGLSEALQALREEADRFFRPGAQRTGLNALKAELDALKAEREAADMQVPTYRRLVDERDRAVAAEEAALSARAEAGARRDEAERLLAALPRLARARRLREALASMDDLPEPPAGWAAELTELERSDLRLDTTLRGLKAESEALERERDGLAVDGPALALAEAHDGLAAARAAAITAAKDLPRRRPSLAEVEGAVATALSRLGRPPDADPEAVLLPAALTGTLRTLVAERSGLAAKLEVARHEAEEAAHDLAAARAALAAGGGTDAGTGDGALLRLVGLLEACRDADPPARRRVADREHRAAQARLADAMAALAPWGGTADQLAGLALPTVEEAEGWDRAIVAAEADAARRDAEAADLAAERDAQRAEIDALGRLAGPIGDTEAKALRDARERAWTAHRARLDAATAEDFEDALRRDDAATAARFGQAADVARLREMSVGIAALETRLANAAARAAAARQQAAAAHEASLGALAALDPPFAAAPTPAGLAAWLRRTGPALLARSALAAASEAVRAAGEDLDLWTHRLGAALAEAAPGEATPRAEDGLEGLATRARAIVEAAGARAALAQRAAEAERRAAGRAGALQRALAAEEAWRERWTAACAEGWLGERGEAPTPAAVSEILELLAALAPDLRTRTDLRHRIVAMECDQDRFAARLAPLAEALGLAPAASAEAVLDQDAALARRIGAARTASAAHEACLARLAEVERRQRLAEETGTANRARGAALRSFFGVDTLAEVGVALKRCEERDRLRRDLAALEEDLRAGLRVGGAAEAEARLDGLDAAELEAARDRAAGRYEASDLDLRQHHAARVAAEAALAAVGGDGGVALIETRRRVVLADIEDQARHFIRLRGGIAAAEQALAAYRDLHRSAMLVEASRAFATVSRGRYTGLAAQPSDKGEILIARTAEGTTKQAGDLSKGTRFQLYLALRAAGYREFIRTRRTAVPFVADDIMETFDDFRAEEAFRLFAGMAEAGQVIYLTHHRHLIDIARAVCPGVAVHRLDDSA